MPARAKAGTAKAAATEPSPVDPMDKARDELRLAHQQRDNARDQLAAARRAVTDAQVELDAAERAVVDAERAWTQVGLQ